MYFCKYDGTIHSCNCLFDLRTYFDFSQMSIAGDVIATVIGQWFAFFVFLLLFEK